jgi:predicted nucleic acid-binding protein
LLRVKGRARLGDDRLELFPPERMWDEAQIELPRRMKAFVRRRHLEPGIGDELIRLCVESVQTNIVILDEAIYSADGAEARSRSRRDPNDWPVVACALALSSGVWTNDNDFLGTGVPTWTTDTLPVWLDRSVDG